MSKPQVTPRQIRRAFGPDGLDLYQRLLDIEELHVKLTASGFRGFLGRLRLLFTGKVT